jgi:hypothetical protein
LDYTMTGKEGNRVMSGKCYWWLWSGKAHIGMAKLASLTEWLAGIVAPSEND